MSMRQFSRINWNSYQQYRQPGLSTKTSTYRLHVMLCLPKILQTLSQMDDCTLNHSSSKSSVFLSFFQYLSCRNTEVWGWKSEDNWFFNQPVILRISHAGPWILVLWKILVNRSELAPDSQPWAGFSAHCSLVSRSLYIDPDWIHDSRV